MNADIDWGVLVPPEPSPQPDTLGHRLANLDDWLTMAAGLVAVIAVAASIQTAGWVDRMPALWFVAAAGLLAGFVTARAPASGAARKSWIALGGALGAGALIVIPTVLSAIDSGGPWARWNDFRDRMAAWFDVVVNGGISDDEIPFILLVASVTWLVSYSVAWSLFALRNVWMALVPLGVVVVFNASYQPIDFDWAFAFFVFAALLLIGRAALQAQTAEWARNGVEFPEFVGLRAFWHTLWVVSFLLLGAWLLPADSGEGGAFGGAWDKVQQPFDDNLFKSGRFFAGVKGQSGASFREFGQTLPLGGSIDLRQRVQMRVEVSPSGQGLRFLRVAAYQQYDRSGWLNPELRRGIAPAGSVPPPADLPQNPTQADRDGQRVSVEVEVRRTQDRIAVPGIPVRTNIDIATETPKPATYELPLSAGAAVPPGTPKELTDLLPRLQRNYVPPGPGSGAEFQQFSRLLPQGYQARAVEHNPPALIVERALSVADALSLDPRDDLERGDVYRVLSIVEDATEDELRAAGATYPPEVRPFLELPDRFPTSVRDLAQKLTAGEATPYDKAAAIERYLRTLPYDETIPRPQPGVDRVERFLFGLKRGYFDYHASAMTVMLRSAGVPARLATGYALEERGEDGRFIVREKHTYSWPEVYFPNIGWAPFNPTPNLPPIDRGGAGGATNPAAGGSEFGIPEFDLGALDDLGLGPLGGGSTAATGAGGAGGGTGRWWWVASALAVIALAAGGGRLYWERSVAGLPLPAKLWEKTRRLAVVAGIGPRPQQTPREFAREVAAEVEGAESIERLARAYERSRFGATDTDGDERQRLLQDYHEVRNRLLARAARRRARDGRRGGDRR